MFAAHNNALKSHHFKPKLQKFSGGDPHNPHPRMQGLHGPRKTFSGAYLVIIGIPERTVYLIVHNTEPFHWITNFSHSAIGMPTNH